MNGQLMVDDGDNMEMGILTPKKRTESSFGWL